MSGGPRAADTLTLRGLGRAELSALNEALKRHARCELRVDRRPRADRPLHQLIPLFDVVTSPDAALQAELRAWLPPGARPKAPPLRVSALIPTNRGTPIGLQALREQDCAVEVIALANGGAEPEADKVLRLPWEGHGPTRQRGVEACEGDYVLFTVDDAIPLGQGCVRAMAEALEAGGFDAVFGRQLPWPEADPITRQRLDAWTPAGEAPTEVPRLDHVFALARRQTLLDHPLPPVPIGEDLRWRRGKRVGYAPRAMVLHSHPRRARALYRRTRDLHLQHHAAGDLPTVPSHGALLRALPGLLRPALLGGPRELPCQLAELLGQWRAAQLSQRS